jgi:FLVCR family MFS transporter 7
MPEYSVSKYRWIILISIIPMIVATEIFWLTFAPVASIVGAFYGVGSMAISMLSMSYMLMYIACALPASFIVDKYGYRVSLLIGAVLTAVFGALRAVFASNFAVVMICQFFVAAGQPFIINISTKVPANWFPENERATAAGLLTMGQYLGLIVPMALSPVLVESGGIPHMLTVYAVVAAVCAVVAIAFTRERPPSPAGPEAAKENLSVASMAKLFRNRNFVYVLFIVFIAMGLFNTLLTLIEGILTPRGLTIDQAGIVGAVFVLAGIIGAVALPILSDKLRVRIPMFRIGIALMVPLYLGLTFLRDFWLVTADAALAGFCIMGLAPILFQHGAEVAYPAKEGTSYGLILMMGQISGMLFVALFEAIGGGTMVLPMLIAVVLTALEIPATLKMRESDTFST